MQVKASALARVHTKYFKFCVFCTFLHLFAHLYLKKKMPSTIALKGMVLFVFAKNSSVSTKQKRLVKL